MKIYICLPENVYYSSRSKFSEVKAHFTNGLKKYYGDIETEIIGKLNQFQIEVYVMGHPKYDGRDGDIKQLIGEYVFTCFEERNINIKLNYAIFNPSIIKFN